MAMSHFSTHIFRKYDKNPHIFSNFSELRTSCYMRLVWRSVEPKAA